MTDAWCCILSAFSGVSQRLRFDNSRLVLCLAAAGNGDWVFDSPFRVGVFLVPPLATWEF